MRVNELAVKPFGFVAANVIPSFDTLDVGSKLSDNFVLLVKNCLFDWWDMLFLAKNEEPTLLILIRHR